MSISSSSSSRGSQMFHLSCASEDEILADPNSYFDVDIGRLHEPSRRASAGHRPSKSSSDSREFDFGACMTPMNFHEHSNISTADELFYKGKLLPLYMSQRLQMPTSFKHPGSPEFNQSSIAFSCYLHRADVDIDLVMGSAAAGRDLYVSDESLSDSRNSGDKDCPSSRDSSSEESSLSLNRRQQQEQCTAAQQQQVLKNEGSSGRFRWRVLLAGGPKASSKTLNCPESFCNSCGKQQQPQCQQPRKSEGEFPPRPSYDPFSTRLSHSGGYDPHQTTQATGIHPPRTQHQSLVRAKNFWRRYLKPLITRNASSSHRDSKSSVMINSSSDPINKRQRGPRSTANTPLASPTHSGLLSVVGASPDDVQGAIAYCKQTRAIANSAIPTPGPV